jgi:hypothetical protein
MLLLWRFGSASSHQSTQQQVPTVEFELLLIRPLLTAVYSCESA